MSAEELGKKLDRLLKQSEEQLQKLNSSSKELRAHVFGQDRYWRRYWELACAGGVYVEAMESAEPEVLELQAELDEKYRNMEIDEKIEPKKEEKDEEAKLGTENRENETPNEVKEEKKSNSIKNDSEINLNEDKQNNHDEVTSHNKELNNCVSDELKNEIKNDADDSKANKSKGENEETKMEVDVKTEEVKKEENGNEEDLVKPAIKIEEKISETIANGDKFSHMNNLHNTKELNGNFLPGNLRLFIEKFYFIRITKCYGFLFTDVNSTESNWFSILPRDTCDTSGPSTKQIFGVADSTELKIPIFPPPASPSFDRCDSPAPLILTQDEATQLEYLKAHGLPPPGEAKPVPKGENIFH